MGEYSGAGAIFGVTGGVMEAVLRTAADVLSEDSLDKVDDQEVRDVEGVKEASIKLGDMTLNVAVVPGGKQVIEIVNKILSGEKIISFHRSNEM